MRQPARPHLGYAHGCRAAAAPPTSRNPLLRHPCRRAVTELFRRQAVDFQRQKFHGAIVLMRSPWQTAIAGFFVVLVLALGVFASTQGFARKESVGGVLLPAAGVLRLVAPQAG